MAELSLVRIDSRLIHGQVLIMWTKIFPSKRILIIDDEIAQDPFMFQILSMAAPPQMAVEVFSTSDAAEQWKKDQFGSIGPVFVIFKNVPMMFDAYNKGFKFENLQLGGIGGGAGRITVHGNISLNEEDARMLQELHEGGLNISLQVTPDTTVRDWPSTKEKFFQNV
ncbi:PTS sugar transporter subunit IIB [Eubacteriales bacterium OttesenSCG-928-N14]|nr:PTS sugar transporter subunit IIB [Eubacteriales bacterium OttesenSCG-928-N14]